MTENELKDILRDVIGTSFFGGSKKMDLVYAFFAAALATAGYLDTKSLEMGYQWTQWAKENGFLDITDEQMIALGQRLGVVAQEEAEEQRAA